MRQLLNRNSFRKEHILECHGPGRGNGETKSRVWGWLCMLMASATGEEGTRRGPEGRT